MSEFDESQQQLDFDKYGVSGDSSDGKGGKSGDKRKRTADYDETRKKEIRETNRIAARECRARKKHLMVELEKTVKNLTAEHDSLSRINQELTIRLETLERTASLGGLGALATAGAGVNLNNPSAAQARIMGANQSGTAPSLLSALNPQLQNPFASGRL